MASRSAAADRRPAGGPRLTALYGDLEITALLRRYRIPRRHRPGGITDRFPTTARITGVPARRVPGHRAGPGHIEQLTGHPAEQVLDLLHQHRKHRIPVRRAGGHSPGTAGNTTTHDDPPHDNPVPPVPRVDGGRMPAPGPDRTPPASGRPVVHHGVAHGGAGTGRRCPPPG